MPKAFGKEVSVVWFVAAGAAATFMLYNALSPKPPAVGTGVARKKTTVSAKKKTDIFNDNDYKIKFATVSEPIRDSFKPLVMREDTPPANKGGIPSAFAAGDGNWVYSGMATVDGVSQALLENQTTGDSQFVVRGQKWKSTTIGTFNADDITLHGPGGMITTLAAGGPTEPSPADSVSAPQPVAPVPVPGMSGPIGPGGNTMQPGQGGNRPRGNGNGNGNGNGGRGNRRNRNGGNGGFGGGNAAPAAAAPAAVGGFGN